MQNNSSVTREFSVEIEGKEHIGRYFVDRKVITVTSELGQKSTQLGGSKPEDIAKLLLSELVRTRD